jgi:hypothetical protein
MKKLLPVIYSSCVLFAACKEGGDRDKAVATKDSVAVKVTIAKTPAKDTIKPVLAVADTTRKDPVDKGLKDKILGLWAAVGDENATFEIGKDKITYPDQNAAYKYVVSGDSIHIRFDGFSGDYKVRKKGGDTLVFVGDEEQVYYRFKTR